MVIEVYLQNGVQINMFTYISCLNPSGSSFIVFKGLEPKLIELKCVEYLCIRNQHMSQNMISHGRDLEWLRSSIKVINIFYTAVHTLPISIHVKFH